MTVSLRLDEKTNTRLESIAQNLGRSKSAIIKQAILEYLEEIEDIADAVTELENIRKGKSKTYTLAEARKKLGLGN